MKIKKYILFAIIFIFSCYIAIDNPLDTTLFSGGVSARKTVLWITGSDLLKPEVASPPEYVFLTTPPYRWRLIFSDDNGLMIDLSQAPIFLHRFMQRICFGIRWRMLEIKE